MMGSKHTLRKKIIKYFDLNLSEYRVHLTSRRLDNALIFLEGFKSCLTFVEEEPVRKEEMDEFLFRELISYLVKTIDEQ